MFTKSLDLSDGSTVQFVISDVLEGLRVAVIIAAKEQREAAILHVTVTDTDELHTIVTLAEDVDERLHPEMFEDDDDDEDDEDDDDDDGGEDEDDDDDDDDEEDENGEDDEDDGENDGDRAVRQSRKLYRS